MKVLDTLDVVIRRQQTVTLEFNNIPQAENYMTQLRRYKSKYIDMYHCTRKGNCVIVSPQAIKALARENAPPKVFFSDSSGVANESLRIRVMLLNDYRDEIISEEDAIEGLLINTICGTREDALVLLHKALDVDE